MAIDVQIYVNNRVGDWNAFPTGLDGVSLSDVALFGRTRKWLNAPLRWNMCRAAENISATTNQQGGNRLPGSTLCTGGFGFHSWRIWLGRFAGWSEIGRGLNFIHIYQY